MISQSFKIREPLVGDVEFILKTWTREIERTKPRLSDGSSAWPKRLFFNDYQAQVITPLMSKANARVIATQSDLTFIAGFVVGKVVPEAKTSTVHFAYTRPPFRRMGLLRQALTDMGHQPDYEIIATHWTRYLNRFQVPGLILNELALYGVVR